MPASMDSAPAPELPGRPDRPEPAVYRRPRRSLGAQSASAFGRDGNWCPSEGEAVSPAAGHADRTRPSRPSDPLSCAPTSTYPPCPERPDSRSLRPAGPGPPPARQSCAPETHWRTPCSTKRDSETPESNLVQDSCNKSFFYGYRLLTRLCTGDTS